MDTDYGAIELRLQRQAIESIANDAAYLSVKKPSGFPQCDHLRPATMRPVTIAPNPALMALANDPLQRSHENQSARLPAPR
jgi:hypothetical protein